MNGLEKIGIGAIVTMAAAAASAVTFFAKDTADTAAENSLECINLRHKVEEYEREERERNLAEAEKQRKYITELERKAAKYDETIAGNREGELMRRIEELEEELKQTKKSSK